MATTDEIRATIESYVARFSAGDKEGWLDLFAPGATVEDPVGSDVRTGRDELGDFWDLVHGMADELSLRIIGPLKVVGHEAAFGQQAVTVLAGTRFGVDIIDVMTFDDAARITTMRAFWDAAEMTPLD